MATTKTLRGFNKFSDDASKIRSRHGGIVRVQESSLAGCGAHTWIFFEGEKCVDHMGEHMTPSPQLDVANTKKLIAALQAFVDAAERDELTEPASVEGGE